MNQLRNSVTWTHIGFPKFSSLFLCSFSIVHSCFRKVFRAYSISRLFPSRTLSFDSSVRLKYSYVACELLFTQLGTQGALVCGYKIIPSANIQQMNQVTRISRNRKSASYRVQLMSKISSSTKLNFAKCCLSNIVLFSNTRVTQAHASWASWQVGTHKCIYRYRIPFRRFSDFVLLFTTIDFTLVDTFLLTDVKFSRMKRWTLLFPGRGTFVRGCTDKRIVQLREEEPLSVILFERC